MNVTSIVLNWNRRDDTLACLAALCRESHPGVAHRVLLVDNGSHDDSVAAARAAYPAIAVLELPENVGYAAGVNAGVRLALDQGAAWTLLVNNDALVEPGALGALVAAGAPASVGMVTPTIVRADAPGRVWPSAGRRRRLTLAPRDTTASPPSALPYDVEWATGCCLLVRAGLWTDIGLFDERYRFYYEDHDLCLRARARGWRIVHVPAARARHRVAASTGAGTPQQAYLLGRGGVVFFAAHTRGLHRVFIVVYRLGSLARTVCRGLLARRPAVVAAYLHGVRDGVADVRAREAERGAPVRRAPGDPAPRAR